MFVDLGKILYCTDLSENAHYAFRHAAQLAKDSGAELHVLHVAQEWSSEAKFALQSYIMETDKRHALLDERVERSRAFLTERQDKFWAGVAAEDRSVRDQIASLSVVEGYPAEEILKAAAARGCQLIVMGAHEKGLIHTFLGSVAKSVLRRTRIPVMIVPLP